MTRQRLPQSKLSIKAPSRVSTSGIAAASSVCDKGATDDVLDQDQATLSEGINVLIDLTQPPGSLGLLSMRMQRPCLLGSGG